MRHVQYVPVRTYIPTSLLAGKKMMIEKMMMDDSFDSFSAGGGGGALAPVQKTHEDLADLGH
jgi:hypothetical protein